MKKYATISLFIFWAVTVAVTVAGLLSYNKAQITALNSDGTAKIGNITGVDAEAATLALSKTELAKHNSRQNCWLLISGKIYDVTNFIKQHSGGAGEIIPTCGTDATAAYASRGGTGSHSSSAQAMLAAYYIGDLNQTVTTSPSNSASKAISSPNPVLPSGSVGDDEEDD